MVDAHFDMDQYFETTLLAETGQEWSWYHCYNFFVSQRNRSLKAGDYDLLCLHLAFYLASCGLYRGSSFLLQNDYKIHKEPIQLLLDERYNPLVGISLAEICQPANLQLLAEITSRVEDSYKTIRRETYQQDHKQEPKSKVSETLLTKVLLGTLGCVPGYDDFFKQGLKTVGITPRVYNQASIVQLGAFAKEHALALTSLMNKMAQEGYRATEMKVLDSFFRQIGQSTLSE